MTDPTSPDRKPIALETRDTEADGRLHSPSAARNRDAIRNVFLAHVASAGQVLEIASGTGEHGAHITAAAPELVWTYSDPDPASRQSQAAWAAAAGHDRLAGPFDIDAAAPDWPAVAGRRFDAIFSANMVHIAPFAAARGLIAGAGRHLVPGGALVLYGPFARNGAIAPSNAAFSDSLRSRNPAWGVRDLDRELLPLAAAAGLELGDVIDMPANNLTVILRRERPEDTG